MGKTSSLFGLARQRKQVDQNAIPLARKNDLILALDFGTTFSGVAYVYRHHGVVSRSTDINNIRSWPGDGDSNHKAPTRIQYLPHSDSKFKWGYEVNPLDDHIFGLKLLFDPDQPKPYDVTDICADPLNLPKPIEEVAADLMRALYNHATNMICTSIAADEIELDKLYEKQYVITVPAVWSDKAKQLTFEAAKKAGVYPLDLITEPEAAALYTLDWMKGKGLKERNAVVICDAGGGTVDLVTYEVDQLEPLRLTPLTASTGAVAGSVAIDARFQEEVAKTVGSTQFMALKTTKAYRAAMREFDVNVKQAFRGLDDDDVYVTFPTAQLPDNPAMGLESNTMAFSAKRIADMFEPTINTIVDLVRSQIKSASEASEGRCQVRFVFLVGGFGSNEYLRRKLEESIPKVKIVQPEAARKAVMMYAQFPSCMDIG
ncbi:hypothetical protein PFICI_02538 [Pestalotiopsis fici W106-1]|uniref:Uncharacterized protein n=1 Tax=Pestalotiopsis fici (strain W106-1 / CGMCC3.15140) TaxID=1229662 RepID=W3XEI2_PESFW|nr:uncharacterized protein PFICI_02538 [Pestalotiopsis fici W106-1]ETS84513.1 hypothetical protein PFICI_02538 [Pestalotiopsis fici W106-1]